MGHNSVVSGHPKSTGILWVDWLSTGPSGFGVSQSGLVQLIKYIIFPITLEYST